MSATSLKHPSGKRVAALAAACGCLALLLLMAGFFFFRADYLGPEYQGRRLADWANDLAFDHEDGDDGAVATERAKRHEIAAQAILHFGTNALPLAMRLCRVENSTFELKLMHWCDDFNQRQSTLHLEHGISYAETKWNQGLGIFRVLGSNAAPAIPGLLEYLEQDKYSAAANNATAAFRYIGLEAIPPLLNALTNNDKNTQRLAAFALSHFGTNAGAATPIILRYMKAGRGELADGAAYTLTKINDDPSVVVPALVEYLKSMPSHPNPAVSAKLASFGTNAPPRPPQSDSPPKGH